MYVYSLSSQEKMDATTISIKYEAYAERWLAMLIFS